MISLVLFVLAVLPPATGLCYSPVLHGLAPDIILPSVFSSSLYCPPPRVFDRFLCICVDPRVLKVRVPTEERTSLWLRSLLPSTSGSSSRTSATSAAAQPSTSSSSSSLSRGPVLTGLPDMHHYSDGSQAWNPVQPFPITAASASGGGKGASPRRVVVSALNPYGSFNIPANSKMLALVTDKTRSALRTPAAVMTASPRRGKQLERLEKVRWQELLKKGAAAEVAAAELAADDMSGVPGSATTTAGSGLDVLMRDSLQRILYG